MSPLQITPDVPTATLELQAIEQRRHLSARVSELRTHVHDTVREKLDVKRYAADRAWHAAGVAALFSFLFGYGTAGAIKRMVR